jgi:ferredoxin
MQRKLDLFASHVRAQETYLEPDTDADLEIPRWARAMTALIPRSLNYRLHRTMYQDMVHFYADASCNGCGICERVCLSRKIELVDDRPVWTDDARCYGCFACINYCPRRAIQIRSRFPVRSATEVTGRYHHPAVTHRDIATQR